DHIRKVSRYTTDTPGMSDESETSGHYSDLQEILERALENLPGDQRAVVMLRDYEGYAYREIAEITGLNESQVKVYIYRARVYLKNYIGSLEKVI
ncbi:MAG: RNA polymerase sigma factor, partial [Bacteroidales bacterium]